MTNRQEKLKAAETWIYKKRIPLPFLSSLAEIGGREDCSSLVFLKELGKRRRRRNSTNIPDEKTFSSSLLPPFFRKNACRILQSMVGWEREGGGSPN